MDNPKKRRSGPLFVLGNPYTANVPKTHEAVPKVCDGEHDLHEWCACEFEYSNFSYCRVDINRALPQSNSVV